MFIEAIRAIERGRDMGIKKKVILLNFLLLPRDSLNKRFFE